MSKLLVAAVAVGAIAAFNLAPQPAQARHCSILTTTARAQPKALPREGLTADCSDTLPKTSVVGASELAPATHVRVGGQKASAHLVKVRQ